MMAGRWMVGWSVLLLSTCQAAVNAWSPIEKTDQPWRLVSLKEDAQLTDRTVFTLDFETERSSPRWGTAWLATSDGLREFDGLRWRRYGRTNGLPSDFVRCVRVTRQGQIWVGTDAGAGRFDGKKFETLGSETGLAGPNVRRIYEDPDGTLWFCSDSWPAATAPGGITSLKEGRWRAYRAADGLPSEYVTGYFLDSTGRRYAQTLKGLAELVGDRWSPRLNPNDFGQSGWSAGDLVESPSRGVLLSTGRQVFHRGEAGWELDPTPTPVLEYGLVATADGQLIAAADTGNGRKAFAEWAPTGWTNVSASFSVPQDFLETIREAPDGSVWAVGYDCLVRWERRNSQWREIDGVPLPRLVDADGRLWFAALARIGEEDNRPVRMTRNGDQERWERLEEAYTQLKPGPRGEVWATSSTRVIRWRGDQADAFDAAQTALSPIHEAQLDRQGTFWAVGSEPTATNALRVAFYDGTRWRTRALPELGAAPRLVGSEQAGTGIWLALQREEGTGAALALVGPDRTEVEEVPKAYFSLFSLVLHADEEEDSLWLLGDNGLRRRPRNKPGQWESITNLLGGFVFGCVTRKDGLWFGCNGLTGGQGGLMGYHQGRWRSLPGEVQFNVGVTADGTVVAGSSGQFTILPESAQTGLLTFDLPDSSSISALIKDRDGAYWLGTGDRVFCFRPDGAAPETLIKSAGNAVVQGQALRVEAEALERFQPRGSRRDCHFSWRVDDGPWSPFERRALRIVETASLARGGHVLEVRALDAGQDLDPTPARWAFQVYPVPLQSRAWFLPTVGVVLALLAALAVTALTARAKLADHARDLEARIAERTADLQSDIAERQRVTEALRFANRELRVLTDCNQTLCRAADEESLLQEVCRIVVETGGYPLSSVSLAEPNPEKTVRMVACHGAGAAIYQSIQLSWDEGPTGLGPTGTAIRTGEFSLVQDVLHDPRTRAWADTARALGHAAACALPLRDSQRRTFGALTVYSSQSESFHADEIALLQELADDLAFGIGALRARAAHARVEVSIRESEERFRQLAENIHEVFWMSDPGRRTLIYLSPNFESIWGRSCADFLAQPELWLDSIHPDDRERVARALATETAAGTYAEEYRILRPDGAIRWIRDRAFPIRNAQGTVYRIAGFAEDISERQRLEQQLRQSQKMEAIGQLSGGIAHDFNNILGAIFGNIELARMDLGPDHPALESLVEVRKASERAKDLVQQILAFARRKPYERRPLALGPILEESARLLRATLPAGAELQVSIAPSLPLVSADATQVQQLVLNLGTNAWHALEGRPGRIGITATPFEAEPGFAVEHPGLEAGPYVRISVEDTGKGMDEHTLEHIFEPFFTTKPPGQGTGLGLSVVHGIMQTHRGAVTVTSRPGQGSTFHLFFPVLDGPAAAPSPPLPPPSQGHGKRVLCLDDERPLVQITVRVLERLGYVVTAFTDPTEALRSFRNTPDAYDLVVTDFNMPGMSGLDVARSLHEVRPGLPVVLSSGFISEDLTEQARQAGVHSLIQKPSGLEELAQAIHLALAATDSPRPGGSPPLNPA